MDYQNTTPMRVVTTVTNFPDSRPGMDEFSRQRRERNTSTQQPPSSTIASESERRHRSMQVSISPAPRSLGGVGSYGAYYQESAGAFPSAGMSTTSMGYGTDYGQDTRQQTQGFGTYNPLMYYNVPQPNTQTNVQPPVYDPRQQVNLPIMTPDLPSTYFGSGVQGSGSGGLYHPSSELEYSSQIAGMDAMQQQQQRPAPAIIETATVDVAQQATRGIEERWMNYQRRLGTVFQDISRGSLERASETLLNISDWLLSQVVDLGLADDDVQLHRERLNMWNNFNHAWLALAFRQKELMSSDKHTSDKQPLASQKLMSENTIKKLGDELIRLCDGVERHGLVDYQYGVWEEQIETLLEDCLDLYEGIESTNSSREGSP